MTLQIVYCRHERSRAQNSGSVGQRGVGSSRESRAKKKKKQTNAERSEKTQKSSASLRERFEPGHPIGERVRCIITAIYRYLLSFGNYRADFHLFRARTLFPGSSSSGVGQSGGNGAPTDPEPTAIFRRIVLCAVVLLRLP